MTPFMQQVEDILSENPPDLSVETVPCSPRPLGEGVHRQVELRALAEQLVCEGNVVLRPHNLSLELIDSVDTERLAFTIVSGRNRAWLVTDVVGRTARARLDAPILGAGERDIAGPEALARPPPRADRGAAVQPQLGCAVTTRQLRTIGRTAAVRITEASVAAAESLGVAVCIAVVDNAGHLLQFTRMDGAPLLSASIAQDKAYSVAAFNGLPTGAWWALIGQDDALGAWDRQNRPPDRLRRRDPVPAGR